MAGLLPEKVGTEPVNRQRGKQRGEIHGAS
jgi:hypothetical protein